MQFSDAIAKFFKDYAVFSGRSRRSEFWFAMLFIFLANVGASILDAFIFGLTVIGPFYVLFNLGVLIPSLAVSWRRLHDIDKSGGFYFLILIPIVGIIILIVWWATDSQAQANRFGPPAKDFSAPIPVSSAGYFPPSTATASAPVAQMAAPVAPSAPDIIQCPMCAEDIKAAAKVCKHCGHALKTQ
jgi:uncharacterized membrane protein YhaH (DUF805 family)